MKAHETYKPVLEKILRTIKIKDMIQFGPAIDSTEWLTGKAQKVISVSQDNSGLHEILTKTFQKIANLDLRYIPGTQKALNFVAEIEESVDLIMVDGEQYSRGPIVNAAFDKTDIILAHDTESKAYTWNQIKEPEGWIRFDFKELVPWTTVWTKSEKLIEALENPNEETED